MLAEFKAFLLKTNALALAVGVIIGVALGNVVNSLVNDLIMPPIGVALGGVDFGSLVIKLKDATTDAAGKPVPEVDIRYGTFINVVIAFVVIAFVVFLIARSFLKEAPAAPPAPSKTCPFCKEANAVDATKCRACASSI
jgi:large conductance mechanosensitive channel